MSVVLLWQPSDCIDLFVIDYIFCVLFSENKYDDDDSDFAIASRGKMGLFEYIRSSE